MDDPRQAAEDAGLTYVNDDDPGLRRELVGDGFVYFKPSGEPVTDEATIARVNRLAIPPAWTDVWICPRAGGHLQATGRDARGRKQYRYHPHFREVRDSTKYEHMIEFARALPAIREAIARHMALRGLPREKVVATVVHLLETTLIRVGNDDYAKENNSFGLTTLRNPHVKVEGTHLKFRFKGKGGKTWDLQLRNRRVAKIVRACQDLPGQRLFQYVDDDGELKEVTSADVNDYLKEITGRDVTAKDFRTWAGTVLAAISLQESGNVKAAIECVARRLGNTPAISRKCYVHPEILNAFAQGELRLDRADEAAVLDLLETRLKRAQPMGNLLESLTSSITA
jgi:DNA topoisomerase-1